jgi:hypothetical protein
LLVVPYRYRVFPHTVSSLQKIRLKNCIDRIAWGLKIPPVLLPTFHSSSALAIH